MGKFRILCVDDNALVLNVVQTLLQSYGYETIAAATGKAALGCMNETFSAAILDYDLPDMDGLKLAKCLRMVQPTLPVLIFSGRGNLPAANAGDVAWISKGDAAFKLLPALARLIPPAA